MRRKSSKIGLNIFKLLSILLFLTFVLSIPLIIQKLITIKKVECRSQYGACPADILFSLPYFEGVDYRFAKSEIKRILDDNLTVESYLTQYQIPNALAIDLVIKKPKLAILVSKDGLYYLISKDGVVLEKVGETNLPTVVKESGSFNLGDRIVDKDSFALKIYEKVTSKYTINSANLEKNELKIKLNDGPVVRFPLEGDLDSLTGSLVLIFSRLNDGSEGIRIEEVHEIDLRFKNPVLR